MNQTRFPVLINHYPQSTSAALFSWYIQGPRYSTFRKFDWGTLKNYQYYGQINPPSYDLSRVRSKDIALIYSPFDEVVVHEDVHWMVNQLNQGTIFDEYEIPINAKYTHYDFIWAKNSHQIVYPKILQLLSKYNY